MNNIREAIRQINMSLAAEKNGAKMIAFTSANRTNSQQTIVANLAIMYARAGEKTLIINTDFGLDAFSQAFGIENEDGLSNFLNDSHFHVDDVIKQTEGQNLSVITSGSIDASETKFLIGDPRMNTLLSYAADKYDRILINTPVALNIKDYMKLYEAVDGVIIVNDLEKTSKKHFANMVHGLRKQEINVLGYISAKR
ncbi:CpsD/CapB family tyrosine-protein kinase [Lactiplantibacillus argentoratensis]|uniref:CpsD/CapB family tyrosine-protein kinase n=1 Tax=Lactiplantibacillus argentoratensis TaxID=271881 RepID=UPI001B33D685|nr:CpsD/CapB family tyrosine-protein kinase [Lactiplantibacillus argentoratensis]MBP5810108.1 CpsD/CapB family tyrosine-protein kinase [Lactiplantibacillus argentoratensis]